VISATTTFGAGRGYHVHLLWFRWLHGDRGVIIWDSRRRFVDRAGTLSQRGRTLSGFFAEMHSGLARQSYVARRVDDPVAVYYSQPSWRVHWLLDVKASGKDWAERMSWTERRSNHMLKTFEAWLRLLEDNGYQYTVLSDAQVRTHGIPRFDPKTGKGFKAVILPQVLALSDAEAQAIRRFIRGGHPLRYAIADGLCGLFDEHGRRRKTGALDALFGVRRVAGPITPRGTDQRFKGLAVLDASLRLAGASAAGQVGETPVLINRQPYPGRVALTNTALTEYAHRRLKPKEGALHQRAIGQYLKMCLGDARTSPRVTVADAPQIGVEVFRWQVGDSQMIAVHRNPTLRVREIGTQEYRSNKAFETPIALTVARHDEAAAHWYDVRAGKPLVRATQVKTTLQAFEPTILAAIPTPRSATKLTAARAAAGEPLLVTLHRDPQWKDAPLVYHIRVRDPRGELRPLYGGNVVTRSDSTEFRVPLAVNDPVGRWQIDAREVLTGRQASAKAEVSRGS
jgi:hypothetical protein